MHDHSDLRVADHFEFLDRGQPVGVCVDEFSGFKEHLAGQGGKGPQPASGLERRVAKDVRDPILHHRGGRCEESFEHALDVQGGLHSRSALRAT